MANCIMKDGSCRFPISALPQHHQPGTGRRMLGKSEKSTNLGLCSDAVATVNPDVFCQDSSLLVEFHVFHELQMISPLWTCVGERG